jgi:hypothetical protein
MALERWLLEFAQSHPSELDATLLYILRESASAALTAVVASVATAYPHSSGETLLVLLCSRQCILLDRVRANRETHVPPVALALIPPNPRYRLYEEERKEADALPHRRCDLVMAIANLQLGPLARRVHEILDRQRAAMRPVEEQDEEDRVWRLSMHCMNMRQYTVAEAASEHVDATETQTPAADGVQYVRLDLKAPEPDVKAMMEQSEARLQGMNSRLALQMWGVKVYGREEDAAYAPGLWRQRLQDARAAGIINAAGDGLDLGRDGPGLVAAVCVRDHWEEMAADERDWCVDRVCSEVEREANQWNGIVRVQNGAMSADRPCAWVTPLLLGKSLDGAQQSRLRQALVLDLTHAINEVRWHAASGIGRHLWTIDRALTLRCVNALAWQAALVEVAVNDERDRLEREWAFDVLHGGGWVDPVEGPSPRLSGSGFLLRMAYRTTPFSILIRPAGPGRR